MLVDDCWLHGRTSWCLVIVASDQCDRDVDVAANGLGIGTGLMRIIDDAARDLGIEARQADIEACPERIGAVVEHEVDLRIDSAFPGKLELALAGGDLHRALEAG